MKLTSLSALVIASLASASFSTSVDAASKSKKAERWFEVEVILFNQLGDKNLLKEQFPSADQVLPLPKYKKVVDLFSRYIQPDIRSLKQQVPACDNNAFTEDFAQQNATLPTLFEPQSLAQLALASAQEQTLLQNSIQSEQLAAQNGVYDDGSTFTHTDLTEEKAEEQTATNNTSETSINGASELSDAAIDRLTDQQLEGSLAITAVEEVTLSEQEIALVAEAESTFSKNQLLSFNQLKTANGETLCRLDVSDFEQYQAQNPDFDYHGFAIDKMPMVIDNIENVYSDKPYLLAKDSLELGDVITQIRRSKNFQPLLHFGWRLAPQGRNKAEAYRVYAGDNFALHHKKKLDAYQEASALDELMAQLAITSELSSANNEESDAALAQPLTPEQQAQIAEQAQLKAIADQVLSIDEETLRNSPELLAEVDSILTTPTETTPPEPISQPWFLDGLFRVHLNHYLYITADFTVMNHKLDKVITAELNNSELELKPIRFQQNRRVISGEIHYFDHPYIGMLVQIRKHKRPEPPTEEELTDATSE